MMARKYFGTDGVRGKVGDAPITPEFVMRLGYAAGVTLVAREKLPAGQHPAVLIGKDTRISGYMLEAALEAGFAAAGVDVMLAGPMPTPAVAYLTRALRLQAGVVISASHNPYDDNGIKFFSADGSKLPDAVEARDRGAARRADGLHVDSARSGKARRIDDAAGRYIEFCKSTFPNDLDLRGLKIVVDCAHGAAYHVAPNVFHELGAEISPRRRHAQRPQHQRRRSARPRPSLRQAVLKHMRRLRHRARRRRDRLIMVDRRGTLYDGDKLLYVIARLRARSQAVPGCGRHADEQPRLRARAPRWASRSRRAKVGDRYVLELMQERAG
jgi:phosphoglucosamine mutase